MMQCSIEQHSSRSSLCTVIRKQISWPGLAPSTVVLSMTDPFGGNDGRSK